MTPEAKAAEVWYVEHSCEGCRDTSVCIQSKDDAMMRGCLENIIAKANAEYYLPLLREVFDFCRFHGIKCDNVVSEIARLESAAKGK